MTTIAAIRVPTPFPVGAANVYLIGNPPVLVDCGSGCRSSLSALVGGLADRGLELSDLVGVVLTHAHPDHSGLAGWLSRTYRLPVFVHPLEFDGLSFGARYRHRLRSFLRQAGTPSLQIASVLLALTRLRRYYAGAIPLLNPPTGDCLPPGWTVVGTPGHTPGHIGLYHEASGALLSGDSLLKEMVAMPGLGELNRAEPESSIDVFSATVSRLATLPVSTVYPGHGQPFGDHRTVIDRWYGHRQRRERRVCSMLAAGPGTVYQVVRRMKPDAGGRILYVMIAETAAHLESLRGRDIVAGKRTGDVVVYSVNGTKGAVIDGREEHGEDCARYGTDDSGAYG